MEWFFDVGVHFIHMIFEVVLIVWRLLPKAFKELPEVFTIED